MAYCNLCCRECDSSKEVDKFEVERLFGARFDVDSNMISLCDECYEKYKEIISTNI